MQCERTNSSGQQAKIDVCFRLTTVKAPDFAELSLALEDECREQCLKNCSCIVYSYYSSIGCMSWSGSLIDLQKFLCNLLYVILLILILLSLLKIVVHIDAMGFFKSVD